MGQGLYSPPKKQGNLSVFLRSNTPWSPRALEVILFLKDKAFWASWRVSDLGAEWGGRGERPVRSPGSLCRPAPEGHVSQSRPLRDILGGFPWLRKPPLSAPSRRGLTLSCLAPSGESALPWEAPPFSSPSGSHLWEGALHLERRRCSHGRLLGSPPANRRPIHLRKSPKKHNSLPISMRNL